MSTACLLAIDPGLDQFGWATFATEGSRILVLQHVRPRLLDHGSVKTEPADALPLRLLLLAAGLRKVIQEHTPFCVLLERPGVHFTYRRHANRERTAQGFMGEDLGLMHVASGALILTAAELLGPKAITLVPASRTKKAERTELVCAVWPMLRNRGSNGDERDAIWIGTQALLDGRRVWEQAG